MSDSQQITLSLNVSGGETEFVIGQLPSSIPLEFLCMFRFARYLQLHAFIAGIMDECCKNIKVVLIIYFKSTCVNNLHNRYKKRG